jgi:hypothetical protein
MGAAWERQGMRELAFSTKLSGYMFRAEQHKNSGDLISSCVCIFIRY